MMIKSFLAVLAGVCLLSAPALAESAQTGQPAFTEQTTKVMENGEEAGELSLRFYEASPHVPYIGMNEYSEYMKKQPLTVHANEDGTCMLENGAGAQIQCDPAAGMITVPDWNRFFDIPLPIENEALGWKDASCGFVRITDVRYEGDPKPVELDFAKYGIAVYADQSDVYLPVSTMTNVMTDVATNHMLYNGKDLYVKRMDLEMNPIKGFFSSETLKAQIQGENRPEDIVKQCYADLCFTLDHFFGHPGIAALDDALAGKGLDQALTDLGEEGTSIKEGLLSASLTDYMAAMNRLFLVYLGDGHTVFTSSVTMVKDPDVAKQVDFMAAISLQVPKAMMESPVALKQTVNEAIPVERKMIWGDENYREYGHTAIIRLDQFMPDEAGWKSYYAGEGDFPQDCLGIVISGLKKASENPEIENAIFDLSCNNGGSPDVMMAILAVTTGQNQLYGYHRITGRKMVFTFEADTDFNGVYDEKDKEVSYDFNYGVLTTRHAFSCGNLFPIIARESGAVVIGEPTSGGSCCVQVGTDAEGFSYIFSSGQWQLTDAQGNSVEGGCTVDIPIEPQSSSIIDSLASLVGIDSGIPAFFPYYDDKLLDGLISDYFRNEAGMDLAA